MFALRLLLTSFVISFALLTATHAAAEEVVVHEQLGVWEDPFHRRSPNFVIDNAESLSSHVRTTMLAIANRRGGSE